ncbi:E3 ubiquitin-protein ligase listerin [Aphelenchoides fujianensis]|nr:E3 ubiquitin-protein ligase listerin [Aphelenchoides fujianensis]
MGLEVSKCRDCWPPTWSRTSGREDTSSCAPSTLSAVCPSFTTRRTWSNTSPACQLGRRRNSLCVAASGTRSPPSMQGEYSNSLLPFILSLERASERVKDGQDEENVALVVLSDLQTKVENEDIDWLFNANGEDMMKDALSCALMRLFVRLAHVVHELPPKIHELVLCGLVTICTNFVANFRSDGLVRLLAMQGLEFFVKYDHSLTNQLAILRSSVVLSDELLERRSKLETTLQEWRDFFCATTAAHALAWFFWAGAGPNASPLPDFFRVHVAKILHHCDAEVGLFEVVRNPTPLLVAHLADGNEKTPTTAEVFAKLVDFLFSKEAALQLTAVHLLQRADRAARHADGRDREPRLLGRVVLPPWPKEGDERTEAEDRIEHKICRFFSALLDRFDADDQYFVESIDPSLVVADLLIRVVRLLDAKVAAVVCANLGDGKQIHRLFLRICKYLSFSAAPDVIKRNVQQTPAHADKAESITQRVMTIDGYACWLYRRALETLPAIVREWFVSVQNKPLQEFTKKFISPVLIENEMRNATISLPEDYPLSQVAVEHDKRNVLSKGMTKKIHLDLFAFVNNRNGSILDGILQWKQNVEKSTEGAEPCAICLSVVSSTNYRLPRLRCRKCHKKFHDDCMYKWIKTTDKPSCPLCRNVFT